MQFTPEMLEELRERCGEETGIEDILLLSLFNQQMDPNFVNGFVTAKALSGGLGSKSTLLLLAFSGMLGQPQPATTGPAPAPMATMNPAILLLLLGFGRGEEHRYLERVYGQAAKESADKD